jgi:S1-C subfamily serine protease
MVILVPLCSMCQTLEEFQTYFDNKKNLDEIEGIYTANFIYNADTRDVYNNTNSSTNKNEEEVIAIKGYSNKFYLYYLNKETNLFRDFKDMQINKSNNLYRLSFTDESYYNLQQFAILSSTFTLSFNRKFEYMSGQIITESEYKYIVKEKLYPKQNQQFSAKSGTCFAINSKGYLVTNYHVVKDATNIYITITDGNTKKLKASLISYDEELDIAVLKINIIIPNIPFVIKNKTTEVGTTLFTLGYPLTQSMGTEVKLSAGIINSKSGFKGDSKYYQISNPIQPGNSGGPLFDSQGYLIGLVTSKYTGGDNVGYALKSNLLLNYLESLDIDFHLNKVSTLNKLSLQVKYKSLKKFVYLVEVD